VDADETHALGYERVDDDPNVSVLLETMGATGRWEATLRLRAWEREQLNLTPGQRLLDVGCGQGDAALALADDLGSDGEIVGIDVSAEMIAGAQSRARTARCSVRFTIGDALELSEPNGTFDAARSERTLQWLTDPKAAVAEMARVLRPGGLLSLIDTDWSTFDIDVGDADLAKRVHDAMQIERRRPSNIGRRLADLVQDIGFELVDQTTATQHWTAWNPDESPAPDGCFSMSSLAEDLIDARQLGADDRDRFMSTIHAAARESRFSMALTMFGVVALASRSDAGTSVTKAP
jgi:SAM-dependent methyltransferase